MCFFLIECSSGVMLLCVYLSDSRPGKEADFGRSRQHTGGVGGPNVSAGPEELSAP